jgi:hypothetical protein
MANGLCSATGCHREPVEGQRYCQPCRNEKQKEAYYRKKDRIARLEYERRVALGLAPKLKAA